MILMEKGYAELILYSGRVCNTLLGVGEGRFDPGKTDDWSKKRYADSFMHVRSQIDHAARGEWSSLRYAYPSLLENEAECRKLIEYLSKNVPNSQEVIELIDAGHGEIRFYRKMRFEGATKEDKKNLIDIINKSGIVQAENPYGLHPDYFWEQVLWF
ncbi:hypothetical protein COT07_02310 [Candidatus Woesearchaeota archaeon CG07_land_8_20_14_0_80_44_23]|nr:MAG: hypothetical protein COT07_02310 [Candidatus Woesearchaeota archaeon CG07_land_8_20_14_0_80_44_23]